MIRLFFLAFLIAPMVHSQTNVFPSSGNVGIGTTSPNAKITFNDLNDGSNGADGITWYNPSRLDYGIYRTAGSWTAPNYQQLKINFETGIILNPGASYGKSFVDIQGGGLRVTSGNVGIGTASPGAKLEINQSGGPSGQNQGLKILAGNSSDYFGNSQIAFSYGGGSGGYSHVIKTRHNSGSNQGNAFDFYVWQPGDLVNGEGSLNVMTLNGDKVGIGTSLPDYKLQVTGGAIALDEDQPLRGGGRWLISGNSSTVTVGTSNPNIGLRFDAGDPNRMFINGTTGNVGIGTVSPNEKLTVNGTIYGKEVRVDLSVPGPDYVFDKDYPLLSLNEIKEYIEQNSHLPEVPSAEKMAENGIELGLMNMLLLKKIEELTLYLIQLQNTVDRQDEKIRALQN